MQLLIIQVRLADYRQMLLLMLSGCLLRLVRGINKLLTSSFVKVNEGIVVVLP